MKEGRPMDGMRCPKCGRPVRDGWQVDWATGLICAIILSVIF